MKLIKYEKYGVIILEGRKTGRAFNRHNIIMEWFTILNISDGLPETER